MSDAMIAGIFGIIIAVVTAFLTALGTVGITVLNVWPKLKIDLLKESASRANEHKWNVYIQFIKLIGATIYGEEEMAVPDMKHIYEVSGMLLLIGSDEVVKSYQEFQNLIKQLENKEKISEDELREIRKQFSSLLNQ